MRPFEVLLLIALVVVVGWLFFPPRLRPKRWRYRNAVPALVALVQIPVEGYRWQMVPAYTMAALFLAVAIRGRRQAEVQERRSRARTALRIGGATVAALFLVAAAALPALFPVFRLPQPSGQHSVGFTRFTLVDTLREERFSTEPADRRSLLVEAWYPTDTLGSRGQRAVFWGPPGTITSRLAPSLGLPAFLFDHLALVRTHAYTDAPPAAAPAALPVLIFSHGLYRGFPGQNTPQMEELASHGYAVFSIGHPYESIAVAYPDGRVVTVSETRMDSIGRGMRASGRALERFAASKDRAERAALFRQAIAEPRLLHESLEVWTQDTRFVMDELVRLTSNDTPVGGPSSGVAFTGKLDLSRIGVFGMSFGGTTAGQVCVVEPRCKAGVNLDGTQYGDPIDVPLRVPFMFMTSSISGLNDPVYERAMGPAYSVNVAGSTHFNYSDFSLLSPVFKKMGFLGPIDGERMQQIMNNYLVAFFDTHLKGERGRRSALLDPASSRYPEVRLSSRLP
ncbi:MAG: alpha/beta hydrolase family protein [Gemmatimonadaceae bacterium]